MGCSGPLPLRPLAKEHPISMWLSFVAVFHVDIAFGIALALVHPSLYLFIVSIPRVAIHTQALC
jgi:hypothetical protein